MKKYKNIISFLLVFFLALGTLQIKTNSEESQEHLSVDIKENETDTTTRNRSTQNLQVTSSIPLSDGVYKIKNAYTGMYTDVYNGSALAGASVLQWYTTSASNINHLFKITYLATSNGLNYYNIRPMTNSEMGLSAPTTGMERLAFIDNLGPDDSWLGTAWNQSWAISANGSNYIIKNGSSTTLSYLSAPNSFENGLQLITVSTLSDYTNWIFEPYTGNSLDSINMQNFDSLLTVGETYTYYATMYSSTIGRNGPVSYSVTNLDNTPTDKAEINSTTGELITLKAGPIKVRCTYPNAPYIWSWTVNIQIPNGVYYFENCQQGTYAQIDSNDTPDFSISGLNLMLNYLDGETYQRWRITHLGSCYYKIISVNSGLAITAGNISEITGIGSIYQQTYTGAENQQWYITQESSGYYVIYPKSLENHSSGVRMSITQRSVGTGYRLAIKSYTNASDYSDDWLLHLRQMSLVGIYDEGHDHSSVYTAITPYLTDFNQNIFIKEYNHLPTEDCQQILKYSQIFVSRSHGGYDSLGTFIALTDSDTYTGTPAYLGTSEIYNYTTNSAIVNLSGVELALFVGCSTSKLPNTSLTNAAIDAGASWAIGFSETISCVGANSWTHDFFYYYWEAASDYNEAADWAVEDNIGHLGISSCVVLEA